MKRQTDEDFMGSHIQLRKAASHGDFKKIKKLYLAAFPAVERKPLWIIRHKCHKRTADIWMIEDQNDFIGIAITMKGADMVLLDYFAIDDTKRGAGYGGESLRLLQNQYAGNRFFLEIERTDVEADNLQERKRRKKFYLQNDMNEIGIHVSLFGVGMELLGHRCDVTYEEYKDLYVSNYGRLAKRNVHFMEG